MVDVDDLAQRSATYRSVPAFGPADHDMSGQHPVVGHTDGIAEQLLTAVSAPAGQTRAQSLGARCQQEILIAGNIDPPSSSSDAVGKCFCANRTEVNSPARSCSS